MQRLFDFRDNCRLLAAQAYNEAEGNPVKARAILRAKAKAYGMDPMTIMLLIQIAIKIWMWAKEQGYLQKMPVMQQANEPHWMDVEDDDE